MTSMCINDISPKYLNFLTSTSPMTIFPSPLHLNCLHTITKTVEHAINTRLDLCLYELMITNFKGPSLLNNNRVITWWIHAPSLMTTVNLLQFPCTPALTTHPACTHSQMAPPSTPQRSLETNTSNPNSTYNPSPLIAGQDRPSLFRQTCPQEYPIDDYLSLSGIINIFL